MMAEYFMGVDVGTGSVRAGLFSARGELVGLGKKDISVFREAGLIVEQSGNEIWYAVCAASREAVAEAGIDSSEIRGIGFDATCSLVVVGEGGAPLAVGPSEDAERNVIVWMDHRALAQAERINATGHAVLDYVGGRISPEMETPKLLWLKENRRQVFDSAWQFFDLTDYLTWRATGSLARSICTVTCKWTYLAHESRWDDGYFREIGLEELADEGFIRIGREVVEPGTRLAGGLLPAAAAEMGLRGGTCVAAGLIDAHAGGIGTVGAGSLPTECMAYVFGTSSCSMTTTVEPTFIPGVWGPYYSAMIPNFWLNEGGQSAAGAAIDQLLKLHPAAGEARAYAEAEGVSLPVWLADRALEAAGAPSKAVCLAKDLHVVPEFAGNRAPFADPGARAVIAGLGMDDEVASLISLYVAGLCGISYGLRQIVQAQAENGAVVKSIAISGGAGRHSLIRQLFADATGLEIVVTRSDEPVLLGSAILGAVAAGVYEDLPRAMSEMTAPKVVFSPADNAIRKIHEARFETYLKLQQTAREIRMN